MPAGHVSASAALLRYMLITALHDRLFLALPVMLSLGAALAVFLGGSAIIEQREMAAAFFGAGSRILVILGLVLFACFHIRQAMAGGEVALILSRPISRGAFVLIYAASLVIIGVICVAVAFALAWFCARPPAGGLTVWALSLLLEAVLMLLTAMFFSLTLTGAVSPVLASLGFYVLARMSGLLGALAAQAEQGGLLDRLMGKSFAVISMILPRLDFFARSEWLVYGWEGDVLQVRWAVLQAAVFIPLLLAASMIDFSRKRL